ncbi:MAG: ABC transporter permease [Candidatus Wallbacteria bacterium]
MDIIFSAFYKCVYLIANLDPYLIEVSVLTITLSAASTLFAFVTGVPLGYFIAESNFWGKNFLTAIINTGMGLPPVVVGLFVALLFGRAGIFGALNILYSKTAIFLSQFIIAFPLSCGLTIAACMEIPASFKLQLESLGVNNFQKARYMFGELKNTMPVILLASFGSVISEVGAVIMVGGNILGETRVLTTAIVSEVRIGNYDIALAFAIVLLLISFAVNYIITSIQKKKKNAF